jgi:hypothetical protein
VSVSQHNGAIVNGLTGRVVAVGDSAVIVGAVLEDGELLVEVSTEEGEERYDGEDDVGYEGVCAGGECGCEAEGVLGLI